MRINKINTVEIFKYNNPLITFLKKYFKQLSRRCVTEEECRLMPIPQALDGRSQPNIKAYKILNNKECVYMCPSGYMEVAILFIYI